MTEGLPAEVVTVERCRACGGASLAPMAMAYRFHGRLLPAVRCRVCDARFLSVQPAPAALAALYDAEYFDRDYRCGRADHGAGDESMHRAEHDHLLDELARWVGRSPGGDPPARLLEVGSAYGWLLEHARARGWDAQGVELSADAVARSRARGLEVFHGDLPAARLPGGRFDLVFLGDVLEHVPDCRVVMAEAARVLAPGGVVYLRGPITTNSLARRVALAAYGTLGRTLELAEPPYHLWEFTPRSLRRLFRAVGLEVEALRQSKIPPGRPYGRKTAAQRLVMGALDALNLPLTRGLNVLGDRIVIVGRKPGRS